MIKNDLKNHFFKQKMIKKLIKNDEKMHQFYGFLLRKKGNEKSIRPNTAQNTITVLWKLNQRFKELWALKTEF